MGAYLNKPITTKESSNGLLNINGQQCPYAHAAMQGWRVGMEDMYTVVPEFDRKGPLLGVFDGHGGKEVAMYCSKHFSDILKDTEPYQKGEITAGLCQAFMNCDRKLLTQEAINEMKTLSENDVSLTADDANEDELEQLSREADMPLENVLQACIEDRKLLKYMVNMANREEIDEESEEESSDPEASVEETQRSKLYSKFIKELTSQYKPALNELQEYFGEDSDSEEEEDEEEEEEEEEGEEVNIVVQGSEANESPAASSAHSSSSNSECMRLRKRTRTTTHQSTTDNCKRIRLDKQKGEVESNHEEEQKDCKEVNQKEVAKDQEETEDQSEKNVKNPEGFESGTTATICLVRNDTIYVANAGDSRCVLSCNGEAVDLSLDHKPTDPIEKYRIEKAGGHVDEDLRVDGGLNMSRAIGDHIYKVNNQFSLEEQMITAYPDVLTRSLSSSDEFLVLASDGIWNCMESQEVVEFIRKRLISSKDSNLSCICEELCDACLAEDVDNDGAGCDNMTIILTLLKPIEKLFKKPL